MTSPAIDVEPEATMREIAEIMDEQRVGAVIVLGPRGLEGVVSERDIVRCLAEGLDPDEVRAADVMAVEPAVVTADDELEDAVAGMAVNWVRHLPVLGDDGEPEGMVSVRDVLLALTGS